MNSHSKIGRRRTLQMLGAGGLAAGGLFVLGCSKTESGSQGSTNQAASGPSCKTAVDETSKNLRKALQYKEKADSPEKTCAKCLQYTAKSFGDCGGCKLFTGPVEPEGGCLSFAPAGAEGGAAPATSG